MQVLSSSLQGTGWAPGCAGASTRENLVLLQEQLHGALLAASYRITAYFLIKMLNSAKGTRETQPKTTDSALSPAHSSPKIDTWPQTQSQHLLQRGFATACDLWEQISHRAICPSPDHCLAPCWNECFCLRGCVSNYSLFFFFFFK